MAIDDLEPLAKVKPEASKNKRAQQPRNFNFNYFPRYQVIQELMNKLAQKSNNISRVISIGNTSEGRIISAMKIQGSSDNPVRSKFYYLKLKKRVLVISDYTMYFRW